jgi:hypothetical protein
MLGSMKSLPKENYGIKGIDVKLFLCCNFKISIDLHFLKISRGIEKN